MTKEQTRKLIVFLLETGTNFFMASAIVQTFSRHLGALGYIERFFLAVGFQPTLEKMSHEAAEKLVSQVEQIIGR